MLRQQIEFRMRVKNLSVAQLERLAGLKIHAVRNILKGRIKKPNAENLMAIAAVLDCSLVDLLDNSNSRVKNFKGKKLPLSTNDLKLLQECLQAVFEFIKSNELTISVEDFLECSSKVYEYSVFEEPREVDSRFLRWILKNLSNFI